VTLEQRGTLTLPLDVGDGGRGDFDDLEEEQGEIRSAGGDVDAQGGVGMETCEVSLQILMRGAIGSITSPRGGQGGCETYQLTLVRGDESKDFASVSKGDFALASIQRPIHPPLQRWNPGRADVRARAQDHRAMGRRRSRC